MKGRKRLAFLTLDEVLALHADQIGRYGGSTGVRDLGLLESALAAPRATFGGEYLHGSLPEIAAAYLFHLSRNHPFVDGNKRAGLAVAIAFLGLNGLWLEADSEELGDHVLRVAEGAMPKSELAEFIRRNVVPFGECPRTGQVGAAVGELDAVVSEMERLGGTTPVRGK